MNEMNWQTAIEVIANPLVNTVLIQTDAGMRGLTMQEHANIQAALQLITQKLKELDRPPNVLGQKDDKEKPGSADNKK